MRCSTQMRLDGRSSSALTSSVIRAATRMSPPPSHSTATPHTCGRHTVSVRAEPSSSSSVPSAKELLSCKLQTLTELLGGSVRFHGDYPAWTYARESALRDRCVAVYEAQYGAKPQIVAIHAGLECGILSGKIDGLDCISFGPNLLHVHTPNERADIASVARVWEYLKAILAYKA